MIKNTINKYENFFIQIKKKITLNNVDESVECIMTIKKLFEEDVSKLFASETQQSKDKLNVSKLVKLNFTFSFV